MVKTTNYQNGKIYKVMNSSFDMCYIGSTIDKLSNRMNSHRSKYRKYKEGKGGFSTIYAMFDKYGENNCKIYLIENYPCQTKDELFAREGHYQKSNDCINKNISGRSHQEYRQDNKERLNEKHKEWANNNQEHLQQYKREYNIKNREERLLKAKQWRDQNKELKNQRDREYRATKKLEKMQQVRIPFVCPCGSTIQQEEKKRHEKSKKHQNWLKQQEPEQEAEPAEQLD